MCKNKFMNINILIINIILQNSLSKFLYTAKTTKIFERESLWPGLHVREGRPESGFGEI